MTDEPTHQEIKGIGGYEPAAIAPARARLVSRGSSSMGAVSLTSSLPQYEDPEGAWFTPPSSAAWGGQAGGAGVDPDRIG